MKENNVLNTYLLVINLHFSLRFAKMIDDRLVLVNENYR